MLMRVRESPSATTCIRGCGAAGATGVPLNGIVGTLAVVVGAEVPAATGMPALAAFNTRAAEAICSSVP